MKITFDFKSLAIGGLAASLCLVLVSSKDAREQFYPNRYFTTTGAANMVVIVDTYSGRYLIAPDVREVGKVQ
ncbi:hypothetical protein [Pedobacter agri]|uniref:hypothetical protein n=1 Tax=Pedobacter agri TaxID=454586 RepID=UPI002930C6D6|nr:hypothetical protein [Pedobacter agri]